MTEKTFTTRDHNYQVVITKTSIEIGCRAFTRRQWDRVNSAFDKTDASGEMAKLTVQGYSYEVTKRGMDRGERCKLSCCVDDPISLRRSEVNRINKALEKLDA